MDMRMRFFLVNVIAVGVCLLDGNVVVFSQQGQSVGWPQAAGPKGNWIVDSQVKPARASNAINTSTNHKRFRGGGLDSFSCSEARSFLRSFTWHQ